MSEVQSRPAASRGRGGGRGGRGGISSRGGRTSTRGHATNGDKHDADLPPAFEDDAELASLRKQYAPKINLIKEMFPEWSDVDIVYALQETNGDENETVTRIADGKPCALPGPHPNDWC